MILGSTQAGSYAAALAGTPVSRTLTPSQPVVVNSVAVLIDGQSGGDGAHVVEVYVVDPDVGTQAQVAVVEVQPGQDPEWIGGTIDRPIVSPASFTVGVRTLSGAGVARARYRQTGSVDPAIYAVGIAPWAPPTTVDDEVLAGLPLDAAKIALASGGTGQVLSVNLGWRYDLDAPPGPATLLARRDGPLADLVGERLAVTVGERAVTVFVSDMVDFDPTLAAEDGRLSREAFAVLAPLATDLLLATVEVLS